MLKCTPIQIKTPAKFLLNGLFFGSDKSKKVYIFVHGLGGSIFSQLDLVESLADSNCAALTFNNKGNGVITKFKKLDPKSKKGYQTHLFGSIKENFVDCVDDIAGAIKYCTDLGIKNIVLVGHSTGCQKIVYYLSHKKNSFVEGAVLLAPISDYSSTVATIDKKLYKKDLALANKLIKQGKGGELFKTSIWPFVISATRFVSLYTPDSAEEIFTYATDRKPKFLQKINAPLLVVLAGCDEYNDRPVEALSSWFSSNTKNKDQVKVVEGSSHSFHGFTPVVTGLIKKSF